ncbi:hypothetical protein D3C71_2119250 [compost metagenome]
MVGMAVSGVNPFNAVALRAVYVDTGAPALLLLLLLRKQARAVHFALCPGGWAPGGRILLRWIRAHSPARGCHCR